MPVASCPLYPAVRPQNGDRLRPRQQWIVILLGLGLLLGPVLAGRGGAALDARPASRGLDIRAILDRANPHLGPATLGRIAAAVRRCERDQGVDAELVLRVMLVESMARPGVRSPKGATGLMQVMPHMFRELDLPGNLAHIEANVEAGCLILADNIRRLGPDDGVSAYFWGNRIRGTRYLEEVRTALERLDREVPGEGSEPLQPL